MNLHGWWLQPKKKATVKSPTKSHSTPKYQGRITGETPNSWWNSQPNPAAQTHLRSQGQTRLRQRQRAARAARAARRPGEGAFQAGQPQARGTLEHKDLFRGRISPVVNWKRYPKSWGYPNSWISSGKIRHKIRMMTGGPIVGSHQLVNHGFPFHKEGDVTLHHCFIIFDDISWGNNWIVVLPWYESETNNFGKRWCSHGQWHDKQLCYRTTNEHGG